MDVNIVREKGNYSDWEKINIVKGMMQHYNEVKIGEKEYMGYKIPKMQWQFDDLVKPKIDKLEKEYIARKQDKKRIAARRYEINELLKNELLSENKRAELINEYNDIGLKWFGNNDDELYEAIIIASTIKGGKEYIDCVIDFFISISCLIDNYLVRRVLNSTKKPHTITTKNLVDIIMMMKYIVKYQNYANIEKISIDSLLIAINAIILERYDKCYQAMIVPIIECAKANEYNELIEYLESFKTAPGPFINLYNLFVEGLKQIDVNEFLQVFPLKKDFSSGKFGCKDYFSSKETLEKIKLDERNFKDGQLTTEGARFLFSELEFEEEILFSIQVQMFHVIGYGTEIDTLDLMLQFMAEAEKEANNTRPKLTIVK